MKNVSVKLKRCDSEMIRRYVRGQSAITHDLDIQIHRGVLTIHNNHFMHTNNSFIVHLKVSDNEITVSEDMLHNVEDKNKSAENPKRHLRSKANSVGPVNVDLISKRKICSVDVKSKPKTIYQMTGDAWSLCKIKHKQNASEIVVRDVVMAKLRGYMAWPAIIVGFIGKNRVKVEFFGADQSEKIGFVNIKECTKFCESSELVLISLKRNNPKFEKAVREAELLCGVPSFMSITDSK